MLRPIDQYFLQKEEPIKSCLEVLRRLILNFDEAITEEIEPMKDIPLKKIRTILKEAISFYP